MYPEENRRDRALVVHWCVVVALARRTLVNVIAAIYAVLYGRRGLVSTETPSFKVQGSLHLVWEAKANSRASTLLALPEKKEDLSHPLCEETSRCRHAECPALCEAPSDALQGDPLELQKTLAREATAGRDQNVRQPLQVLWRTRHALFDVRSREQRRCCPASASSWQAQGWRSSRQLDEQGAAGWAARQDYSVALLQLQLR